MNEDFRKSIPAPLEAIPFDIPRPYETELANGLKIIIVEDSRHPIVTMRLAFRSGEIDDPKGLNGLTSAMTELLNEGTGKYSSRELAERIENLGANLSVSAGLDNTLVRASTLSAYRGEVLDLIAELVLRPTFPENELNLYKQNAIEGLKYQRSQPDFLADEQMAKAVYGDHPYGTNSPNEKEIEKITRDEIIELHKRKFIPNNATLIAIGDVRSETFENEIEGLFGEWKKGEVEQANLPAPPERAERELTIVDRPGSSQANIVLSNLAISRNDPDYFRVLVMNQILGAGASSRLFMNLREEKGYTYGAYSRIYAKRHLGSFEATSEVRTAVTGESLKEFFYELDRIRNEKPSEDELIDAKNFLSGVFPIRAETQGGLTNLIVAQMLYDLPDDYLQTYREKVNAVTGEEVQRVANKYVLPDQIAMVIVGDAEAVLPQAREFAQNIEIVDAKGKPKSMEIFENDPSAPTMDIGGAWALSIDFQGQKMPVTLVLEQDGDSISGKMESMIGEGEVQNGSVKGNKISASVSSDFQGQSIELIFKGTVDGDSMTGTISTSMIPAPMEFAGKRT
ncbi:MAG: insulinase family protein [Pyrinomonadaceae bacterium]|nr:insulinase family protein [Pyrinomonadaceae bacterium]